jgi:hypothetical protein
MVYSFPIFLINPIWAGFWNDVVGWGGLNRNNGGILTKLGIDIVYDII